MGELEGVMESYAPKVFKMPNKIYASSLLGTGGDRTDVALCELGLTSKWYKAGEEVVVKIAGRQDRKDTRSHAGFQQGTKSLAHDGCWDEKAARKKGWSPTNGECKDVEGNALVLINPCFARAANQAGVFELVHGGTTAVPVFSDKIMPGHQWFGGDNTKINVIGDITGQGNLMSFLKAGGKITNTIFTDGEEHYNSCMAALKVVYRREFSESRGADADAKAAVVGVNRETEKLNQRSYRKLFEQMALNLVGRKGPTGGKRGAAGFTDIVVASVASYNSFDVTKANNAKSFPMDAYAKNAQGGCAQVAKEGDKYAISACRAATEPLALALQMGFTETSKVKWNFIKNDFAQAAAQFALDAKDPSAKDPVTGKPPKMRLYADGNSDDAGTFEAEEVKWNGQEENGAPPTAKVVADRAKVLTQVEGGAQTPAVAVGK